MMSDLLTAPVEPGDQVVTGVTLPPGAIVSAAPAFTKDAAGAFRVDSASNTPLEDGSGVWYELRATNTSDRAVRLTALIDFEPA